MYETEQQARDASAKLKQEGYPENMVFLVTPGTGGDEDRAQAIAAALEAGKVLTRNVSDYMDGIKRGRSLVICTPLFGYSQMASEVMDSFDPVDRGGLQPAFVPKPKPAPERGAPLSSALGLAVLTRTQDPGPLSSTLGIPMLSHGHSFLRMFGEIGSPNFALSSLFGIGLLSSNSTPLSSMFGLKTLLARKSRWKSSLGLPLLWRQSAPISGLTGVPLLLGSQVSPSSDIGLSVLRKNRPAPLSHLFGLPLISSGRSALSQTFEELTSPNYNLSSMFGLALLRRKSGPLLPLPTVLRHKSGKKSSFGLPLLSNNPAPLSSSLGLSTLTGWR
jgi:hypothetical protein